MTEVHGLRPGGERRPLPFRRALLLSLTAAADGERTPAGAGAAVCVINGEAAVNIKKKKHQQFEEVGQQTDVDLRQPAARCTSTLTGGEVMTQQKP